MINSIGIKHFRSLKELKIGDENCIDLKPITVLLGQNSSGKSSFLRVFPLLKQSATSRTRGALALFGDEVDFGDFKTTLSSCVKKNDDEYIEFHFMGELSPRSYWHLTRPSKNKVDKIDVKYKVRNNNLLEILYVSEFTMKMNENIYSFAIDANRQLLSLKVNGKEFIDELKSLKIDDSGFLTCFPFFNDRGQSLSKQLYTFMNVDMKNPSYVSMNNMFMITDKEDFVKKLSNEKWISYIFRENEICQFLKEKKDDDNYVTELYNRILLFKFEYVYRQIVEELIMNFAAVSYSKPLRANADRYYRSRSLSSNEVNSDGSNLVDFYICLGAEEQTALNKWMTENFGFYYSIKSSEGHKSIYIHEKKKAEHNITNVNSSDEDFVEHNITDMGFGFSQILPIATQLWSLQKGTNKKMEDGINHICAIEQPELHLHPAMQCKLINALAKIPKIAKENRIKISFIVETHSETMVNQLGRLIGRGDLSNEDVSVLIFSKENASSFTEINRSTFNSDGELTHWPIGFFGEDA